MNPKERKLIGIVIVGTLRNLKQRRVNILEVAEALKSLHVMHGSLEKVAKSVKLSPEMVREFLKLLDLSDKVKILIKKRFINSVDIGYRISKLQKNDQMILAKNVIDKNLSSYEVRSIVKYKLDNPRVEIREAIKHVLESMDKKYFVAYLSIEEPTFDRLKQILGNKNEIVINDLTQHIFSKIIKNADIISFSLNGTVIIIKVTRKGLIAMRRKAKELRVSLSKLADALVKHYLNQRVRFIDDQI